MPITIFDGIVIAVVLFSAILAMVRGFSREILSIASWAGSVAAAYYLYPVLLPYARNYTDDDKIAIAVRKGNDLLRQSLNWALFRIWEKGRFTDLWLRYFSISPF